MKRISWVGIGLLAAVGLAGCQQAQSQTPGTAPTPKPQEAYYTMPQMKSVTDFEDFTGHTEAVETVTVRARVSGYLNSVNFKDGDEINKNDVLFEIDSRPYVDDLKNKEALVAQNERHLQRLKSDFDRAQTMLASKAISQEQYDQYRYDYIEEMATLQAATASRESSQLNVQFTQVTAPISGKASRRLVDPGNLVIADNTPLVTIVSEDPIYGDFDVDEHTLLRLRRLVEEGKLKKDANLEVKLALSDETDFTHEGTINFVDNQVDAQTGTLRFRGTFKNPISNSKAERTPTPDPTDIRPTGIAPTGIAPTGVTPTGIAPTVSHRAPDRMLTPGLFIRVRMYIGEPHEAIVIPDAALATDQGRKYVFVINDKNVATYTPVEVGAPYPGEMRVIEKGLTTADRIVVSGLQKIKNGAPVTPKEFKPEPAEKESPAAGAANSPKSPAAK